MHIKNIPSYFKWRYLLIMLLVAVVYFIVAQDGYLLALGNENVTTLLSPAGFAFAAVLILGYRIWPGILIGAFAYNYAYFYTNIPANYYQGIYFALATTLGNLAQPLIGSYIIKKTIYSYNILDKTEDVFRFTFIVLFAVTLSGAISTLTFFQLNTPIRNSLSSFFLTEYMGDLTSVMLITPLLLGWVKKPNTSLSSGAITEILLILILIVLVGGFIFLDWFPTEFNFKKAYLTLPLLLWAAFRFNQREVVTALSLSSTIAILGTVKKHGPFSEENFTQSFLSAQVYITIVSVTILNLRAAIQERKNSEKDLEEAHSKLTVIAEERKMKLAKTQKEVEEYQQRIQSVFHIMLKYSSLDFSEKIPLAGKADEIDAIASGLNTLGEELQYAINSEKKYTTELEELNMLLKESEEQIQNIFDNAPEAVMVMDINGIVERWNPMAEQIFGWKANEIIGKPFHEFVIPTRYRAAYDRAIQQFIAGRKKHIFNKLLILEVINKEEKLFYASINVSPTLIKGKLKFISFARDITEEKISEGKLHYASLMLNSANDALIGTDEKFVITYWNHASEKMYGYTAEEAIGKSGLDIIKSEHYPPNSREVVIHNITQIGKWSGEVIHFNKQGGRTPIINSISQIKDKDGKMIGFISVSHNISEIKKARDEIKQQQEFLDSIIENIPTMLFIKDAKELRFVRFNKAGEDLIGFSREDLIGKNDYDFFPEKEADFFISKDREVLSKGNLLEIPEEKIHTKNKGVRVLETKKIPMYDAKGEPQYLLGISNDITERKIMEENLIHKSEELSRSNKELEQFAYVASHDLQEPLRMVTSYLQLLSKRYKDKLDNDATEFIGFALDGSNRMRNLINSLLEYSRINRIKPFEKIKTKELLVDVMQDLKTRIDENNAKIKINEMLDFTGDHVLIHQLFLNLISNAIKFRSEKNPEIELSCKKENDEFIFSVKDNGIGIDKKYSEKIFIIFQRLHSKEKYQGTGIGLALCKKIVERHKGKIWVEPNNDSGSTFYFTIQEK